MDEAAAARLAHLEKLLEHANVGVVQADASGRMVATNPCWCEMLGYTEQEMLQLTLADVTHPDSLPATLEAVQKLAAGREGFRIDKRYLRKDGSTLWARSSVSALASEDGTYRGLLAIVVDISDRKQAQDALQASEAMLRATFEQAAVGIVHVGQDGRFLRVNRKFCEMLGYRAEELTRMGFHDIVEPEDREKGLAEFRLVNAGRLRSHTAEKRYRRRDGSTLWVRVTASPVEDAQAGSAGAYHLALVEDITEQRKAEQRARDAAQHDPLTRLPNRRLVFEYAEHLLAATAARVKVVVAWVMQPEAVYRVGVSGPIRPIRAPG